MLITRDYPSIPISPVPALPSRVIAGRGTILYRRCTICRCYILQEGDLVLCLGCVKDNSFTIQKRIEKKFFLEQRRMK